MSKGKCPFCGGTIDTKYKKCKHCGETIADFKQERKRVNIGGMSFCPLPKAGVATILALPFIVLINILIFAYHGINKLSSWTVDILNKSAKLGLTEEIRHKYAKAVAILMWVVLFVIGYISQMNLPNLKYAKCDYACLADRAYALCQKSKTADDKQKQKIYKELSDIQQVMSEQTEYTSQDTIQAVQKKYTDDDLFPADMFK